MAASPAQDMALAQWAIKQFKK